MKVLDNFKTKIINQPTTIYNIDGYNCIRHDFM